MEPACWWTEEELKRCRENLIVTGPHRDWLGREFWQYLSQPQDNIYGEAFAWREYGRA